MEETLGKRISANRKRLGMTQDQLAEQLGVTAQAVSKWENDQSSPDIQTLLRLADIFHISTDELLGAQKKTVCEAEVVQPHREPNQEISAKVLHLGSGRRTVLALALWLLLAGGILLFVSHKLWWEEGSTWTVLWSTGLLIFGLLGLHPRFSVFRLGCAVVGGLTLVLTFTGMKLSWPVLLLILGGLLLIEALTFQKGKQINIPVAGAVQTQSGCDLGEESFFCSASFGEKHYRIDLPRLKKGTATLSFGELELDLTGCREFAEGCTVEINNSFGETKMFVPKNCVVKPNVKTAFGAFTVKGTPGENPDQTLYLTGSVSFGEMTVYYE